MRVLAKFALVLALGGLLPAAASAHSVAQPLVDRAPTEFGFKDRVFTSSKLIARASDAGQFSPYTAADGTQIAVAISSQYGDTADPSIAQSYVDFLDSLDHGSELAKLK